jgi:acyl carrier protein
MTLRIRAGMTKELISAFCIESIAKILRIPSASINPDAKFSRLGLDSAMSVYLLMDLEEKLAVELPPDSFYDHPTINALSAFLAEQHGVRLSA